MRKPWIAVLTVAAAFMSYATPASAADVMQTITSDKLAEILTAMTGKKAEIAKPEAGVEVVTYTDNGDRDFIMSECTAKGCAIVQMTMFFNKDASFNLAGVNGYNSQNLNAQAFLTPDNRVYLVRLYLTIGGVTEENLKANISLYLRAPGVFIEHLSSQSTAATGTGPVTVAAPAAVSAGTGTQASEPQRLRMIERLTAGSKGASLR